MKKAIRYLLVSGVLLASIYPIIIYVSKVLCQPFISIIVIAIYLVYNFVYVKGLLLYGKLSSNDDSLLVLVILLILITLFNYTFIYYGFYRVDSDNFLVSTHEKSLNFLDFFYFSVATIATVGYGDIVVTTTSLRCIVATEIISGIALLIFGLQNMKFLNRIFTGN